MLHEFIHDHRDEILRRTRTRVASRTAPHPTNDELESGIPLFLDELVEMLRDRMHSSVSLDRAATRHGGNRFAMGFTISQVVHDFGDVCQTVTELAMELDAPVRTEEFRVLNRCLDDAIAGAVTAHTKASAHAQSHSDNERLGILAHELRNQLNSGFLAFQILKEGRLGIGGSTGMVLENSLSALRILIDRSLAQVRLDVGLSDNHPVAISGFLEEIEASGVITARSSGISLSTQIGDADVEVFGDRQLLGSAVHNLLLNAFKFTPRGGLVALRTSATQQRVLIEVQDQCGGMSDDVSSRLFKPFLQTAPNRSGMGLGLVISKRAVEAMDGHLSVRNEHGKGCVFAIDLPRLLAAAV